ncbi:restriction endonuclease [Nocardia sp. NPDC005745]|uniref:restriction endonuclease n=1 Tax=Nocardia sp. NPDC005745 TaxID=3157061 RepID=UPI0033F0A5DD
MTGWKNYEDETAAFYRTLGFETRTGEKLNGARGTHKIDVTVRGSRAGMQFLWVVECKHWRRRVTKEKVAALLSIVQDVGADRGIMLSESGFQAGAPRMAQSSNISLTSLSELRVDTHAEQIEFQNSIIRKRCEALEKELDVIWSTANWIDDEESLHFACPLSKHHWNARISIFADIVKLAMNGAWPVHLSIVDADGRVRYAAARFCLPIDRTGCSECLVRASCPLCRG